jgi:hypothetical protein
MTVFYSFEKLYLAISGASSSDETLQHRLANAYIDHLRHISEDNVPAEVRVKLKTLKQALTSKPALANEGTAMASTAAMSDEEARNWLKEIVSMFSNVAQAHGVEMDRDETRK